MCPPHLATDAPATVQATPAQLRALYAGFTALGYRGLAGRSARLAAASAILGLDEELTSFGQLRAGQAGLLQAALRRGEIAPAGEGQIRPADRGNAGVTNSPPQTGSEAAAWIGLLLYLLVRSRRIEIAPVDR